VYLRSSWRRRRAMENAWGREDEPRAGLACMDESLTRSSQPPEFGLEFEFKA
jgi:hypothetical protein